ncbi:MULTISPECIES: phosphate signaling complex protein PhoU [unclassified Kribbella]|uniref:phosphate signaling complex protein PhoU n=1 Tax=unclassified Kribbella TaxID=2644121 RepID=UPI0033CB759D
MTARPATGLVAATGVQLDQHGTIVVDRQMRANVPDVWAAGDCVHTHHVLLTEPTYVPLGTTAHKQGRIAGALGTPSNSPRCTGSQRGNPATEAPMREMYHEQLNDILIDLERMTLVVSAAVQRSTSALLAADLSAAEAVIGADTQLDAAGETVEEKIFDVIARQAPVAAELRMLVAALRMVADLERMGDLAAHVAKIARLRYPAPAIPTELHGMIEEMSRATRRMVDQAGEVISTRDVSAALRIEAADDEMDRLRRNQFRQMMDPSWPHGVEVAVDLALLGRYYERIADHAVSMARRVIFLVTGHMPAGQ